MKSNLLKTALLAVSFLGAASAEVIHTNMPVAFYANGKAMPAGAYTVRTLPGTTSVVVFTNDATGEKALAFARPMLAPAGKSGTSYELSMEPGSTSLKGTALALTRGK
jgi:hypothetical protein